MRQNCLKNTSGGVVGTATFVLLFLATLTSGCRQSPTNRAEEAKKFLAPTDVSKLRPEAREALSHMPGGDKYKPAGQ